MLNLQEKLHPKYICNKMRAGNNLINLRDDDGMDRTLQ
jgi:hypothetical protein